jgi:hypothetical protein
MYLRKVKKGRKGKRDSDWGVLSRNACLKSTAISPFCLGYNISNENYSNGCNTLNILLPFEAVKL